MLAVLNYFDGVNLARSATAPALYLGRADGRHLPAVDRLRELQRLRLGHGGRVGPGAAKDIEVYRFNNHEGGQEYHWIKQLQFLRKLLG